MKNHFLLIPGALALLAALTSSCEKDTVETKEYAIVVTSATGGSAAATVDGKPVARVPEGTTVTLTATSDDGYNFNGWTVTEGGVTLSGNPATFAMPAAEVTVRADFEEGIIDVFKKIADPGFVQYCELMKFDTNGDGTLSVEEARAVTEINVSEWYKVNGERIKSLAGIEYFTSITSLKCYGNYIAEIDLSKNTELIELNVATNLLEELDLSHTPKLTHLSFGRNFITQIDLSPCPELVKVDLYFSSELAEVDFSHNPKLKEVDARTSPKLTTLRFTNNPKLETLYCHQCGLTTLDISKCPELKVVYCYQNKLTSMDVSGCPKLEFFSCEQNRISSLDVSKNTVLTKLYCWANRMKTLDASNMASPNDYSLGCGVQTRDGSVAQPLTLTLREEQKPYWEVYMTIYPTMNGNVELAGGSADVLTTIVDPTFRTYCEQFDTDDDGRLSTAEAGAVTEISVPNMGIKSLAGISYFTGLEKLICNNNEIASLDVTNNPQLTDLVCNDNGMTELVVFVGRGGENLVNLDCQNNKISGKLLLPLHKMEKLNCQNNELSELTLTRARALKSVNCMNNKLEHIWFMEDSRELQMFTCSNNLLATLDLSNKPKLMSVMCNNCRLTSLNLSGCNALMGVMAYENRLATFDATMMQTSFNLFCGKQTSDGSSPLTLTLTLREDQLSHWNDMMKSSDLNENVVLAE